MFHPSGVISSCGDNNNVICCLQNAIISIAKVEEAYKCENQRKGVIEEAIQFLSFDELLDDTDATEDADENRLLPAMNKLWPYLVICLRNKISVVCYSHITSDCSPLCNLCVFSYLSCLFIFQNKQSLITYEMIHSSFVCSRKIKTIIDKLKIFLIFACDKQVYCLPILRLFIKISFHVCLTQNHAIGLLFYSSTRACHILN